MNHIINRPTRVALEETEEGAHKGLRIDAENGQMTLLRFRSPALPETVDRRPEGLLEKNWARFGNYFQTRCPFFSPVL